MKQAYVFLADGFEEVEALTTVDLLRRAGVKVTTASITDELLVTGAQNIPVIADTALSEAPLDEADLIVLPGGMPGTKNLAESELVQETISRQAESKKYVAAICAAPALILGEGGYLKGRLATCYPGMEEHLIEAEKTTEKVAVAENFVTSRGVGTAIPFALKLIELLCGKEKAEEIAESIVFSA